MKLALYFLIVFMWF